MGVMEDRRRIIAAQPHLVTASGSAVLVNITEPKIKRLKVTFAPVQTGSGTPSPSNVRPIMGWSTIAASIGTMPVDISLGGTYYGGVVDLVSGTMTVTHIQKNLTGSDFSSFYGAGATFSDRVCTPKTTMSGVSTGSGNPQGVVMANNMTCGANGAANTTLATSAPFAAMSGTAGNTSLFVMFPASYEITSLALAQSWINEHPITVVCCLATPQAVTLTPQTIAALRGQQTASSPAGSVEISYWTN